MEEFDEIIAKETASSLLEGDAKMYRKFIPEIEKMDSYSLNKLFKGEKNYNYKINNQYQFDQLIDKFNNFSCLLSEWYDLPEYREYLKQIWTSYIVMEELHGKNDLEIEKKLKSFEINYNDWPDEAKKTFKLAFNNTKKSIVAKEEYKNRIKKLPEFWNSFISQLNKFSQFCFNKNCSEMENIIEEYKLSLIANLIRVSNSNFPMLKEVIKDIYHGFSSSSFSLNNSLRIIKENALKYKEALKAGYSSKFSIALQGFVSLGNLYTTISNFIKIHECSSKIPFFKDKIDDIYLDFSRNKLELLIIQKLPTDLNEINIMLKDKIKAIRKNKEDIIELIGKISLSIKYNQDIKKEEVNNLITNLVQTCVGIVGGIVTGGVTSGIYFGCSVINGICSIGHAININEVKDNIEELEKILCEAKEKEKEIDGLVDGLNSFFKENLDVFPNYF